jgi:hypothetical protein
MGENLRIEKNMNTLTKSATDLASQFQAVWAQLTCDMRES